MASGPSGAWPAIAARAHRLDVCNMGYAGSARGEIVSAEHVAALEADVISITHGTNCWTRIPFSVEMMRAGTAAFIDVVRQGHPDTPIVVATPVVRPDAEATPNRLGATLADLRAAMEEVAHARIDAGDKRLTLVPGRDIIPPELLADGIHAFAQQNGFRILDVGRSTDNSALTGTRLPDRPRSRRGETAPRPACPRTEARRSRK